MHLKACLAVVLVAAIMSSACNATPMLYSIDAVGSGTFDGQSFSNAAFSITMQAETANVSLSSPGTYIVHPVSSHITVSGIGSSDAFTNLTQVVANQNAPGAAGFGDNVLDTAILFVGSTQFSSYNLATPIGPISGTPSFVPDNPYPTAGGQFSLHSVASASFSAQVVPEPVGLVAIPFALRLASRRRAGLMMRGYTS